MTLVSIVHSPRRRPTAFIPFALMMIMLGTRASFSQEAPDLLPEGYRIAADTTFFVFNAAAYGIVAADRVVVTGSFRNWSQDMNNPAWQLRRTTPGSTWVLAVANPSFSVIPPGSVFKYRIDGGRWLDPPPAATNRDGGNLVFMFGAEPPRLLAELRSHRAVWATLSGDDVRRPLDVSAYRLVDAGGDPVPIDAVLPNTATETLVVPGRPLDMRRVYYLEIPSMGLRSLCRRDPWFRTLYSSKALGANVRADRSVTTFRLFAPRADSVLLYLYLDASTGVEDADKIVRMARDADGVWEATEPGDHHGVYYDFTVHGPSDPGNWFYGTHPVHISDPYARVSMDSFGKSRVWRATQPARPLRDGRPTMEDVIAYEVHVQDFTDLLPVPTSQTGTFTAMATPGLTNDVGEAVGFDYLVNLGINVVHLMPVQEFLHYPSPEWQAAFLNDPYMVEQGINEENYQWGYRTTHAFAIESRFRERGTDPGAERDQFRDLVDAFHAEDIAVIVDLVPNHTGENMDNRHYLFNFNAIDLPYYYRTNEKLGHIGPFGNEIKTEDRPMVQRWLIDQCTHLIEEFGIDGFRIDLAGQIDEQSLIALRNALDDDVILYGEPWIPPSDPRVADHPDWAWYKVDAPITFFQDDARNAFKGPVSNPENKVTDRGFAGGDPAIRERTKLGLTNGFPDEIDPNRGINYLDIHDNWALADQFAETDWDGRYGVDEYRFKIAATLLFTSLGPIVLHGGTEIMRSKGAAPLEEIIKHTDSGPLAFHGKRDTYNLRSANQFVWDNVGRVPDGETHLNDYNTMLAFWKGLIALRRSGIGSVFRIGSAPPSGYYRWIEPANTLLLGYFVDDRILVLLNADATEHTFRDVEIPSGTWRMIGDRTSVNHVHGVEGDAAVLTGSGAHNLTVPGPGLNIWIRVQ